MLQNEKAFQKQLGVNVGCVMTVFCTLQRDASVGVGALHPCQNRLSLWAVVMPGQKKAPGKAGQRYWKNVGLGFKTPKEAIEGQRLGGHT